MSTLRGGTLNVLVTLLLLALAGCSIQIRTGRRPDVNRLETTLRVGESTQDDVQRQLGNPVGRSTSMMPIEARPRTMWTYFYGEASLKDARQLLLFVYFNDDRYDGYLWFSSFPEDGRTP